MSLAAATARPGHVLADVLSDAVGRRTRAAVPALVRDAALVAGGAALTGAAAQLSVHLPGTPVPVTGQTFAVLLVGTSLGARRGFASLALYVLLGMAGLPWFAGGSSGSAGASFGYLLAYPFAAALVGALARRGGDRTVLRTAGVMALGSLAIYAVGVPWLMASVHVGLAKGLALGAVPFLIGDAVKLVLAAGLLPTAWKLVGRGERG
ncbi:biotin transporter BioY [Mangrovactinospora gilvigrisea]|uniref:Biotin transporter n=1 Tax=Mangrovactinospora gilvigrisea TaxID=1428644 RepID=A0A1J7BW67_9ACTN|nr:biotin transporter BioY [Mangrovactinospora gilvigrisea]OIV37713.1 biotin transporter BioY [Mangrovactinospora gilvigrisea]